MVNWGLEIYLRCFALDKPSRWSAWLSWAEYSYNTSFHSSAGMAHFKALYGRDPPPLIRYELGSDVNAEVEQQPIQHDVILTELKSHLSRAQQKMQSFADSKRRDVNYEVGTFVYVKLRPYRQHSLARKINEKLAPRFYGPFEILRRIGKVTYQLKLPPTSKIHDVFHVSA